MVLREFWGTTTAWAWYMKLQGCIVSCCGVLGILGCTVALRAACILLAVLSIDTMLISTTSPAPTWYFMLLFSWFLSPDCLILRTYDDIASVLGCLHLWWVTVMMIVTWGPTRQTWVAILSFDLHSVVALRCLCVDLIIGVEHGLVLRYRVILWAPKLWCDSWVMLCPILMLRGLVSGLVWVLLVVVDEAERWLEVERTIQVKRLLHLRLGHDLHRCACLLLGTSTDVFRVVYCNIAAAATCVWMIRLATLAE